MISYNYLEHSEHLVTKKKQKNGSLQSPHIGGPCGSFNQKIMKAIKFLLGLGLMVASSSVFSQGLEGIVVEKYYKARTQDLQLANDNAEPNGALLNENSVTYRVYVDLAAGYKLNAVYGNAAHPATFQSTTEFYNYLEGAEIQPLASATTLLANAQLLDSYFTIGNAANNRVGVVESEDGDATNSTNAAGILQNNPGDCYGAPLFGTGGKDGLVAFSAGTNGTVDKIGLTGLTGALGAAGGTSVTFNGGSYYSFSGIVGPGASNKVFIGQFTTDGNFSFSFNVQVQPVAGGAAQYYVASNPTGSEIVEPTLTLNPNTPPTVSITSITQPAVGNTNIVTGAQMTFTADASDNVSVSQVEFFVDGQTIGVDTQSPYSATYIAAAGVNRVVTAVAKDNDCVTTTSATSAATTFTVASNTAPTVVLTAPTSAIANSVTELASTTFTADVTDNDGVSSISSVKFYVNNNLVNTDNTAPYTYVYSAGIAPGQQVKAVAEDSGTLTGQSNIVSMTVVANVPPTVSITSPTAGAAFAAPTAITFTATAGDSDGTISQVEFFVNGVSVGTDATSTYSATWTSTPGIKTITAKATDSNGGTTTSASLTLDISDPNALDYQVKAVTQVCNESTFCVPISTGPTYVVNNVRGYDLVINYAAADVEPTGNITLGSTLTNPSYVEYSSAYSNGTLNLSLYFNGTAPSTAEFAGQGDIFCVEFTRLGGFGPVDSSAVSVSSLQESYITGVTSKLVTPRKMYSFTDQNYEANLDYWTADNVNISYDAANPGAYLKTEIQGYFGAGDNNDTTDVAPVVPNVAGSFTHVLNTTVSGVRKYIPNIAIERDIINTNDINSGSLFTTLVGSADAAIGKTVLLNQQLQGGVNPSIYQMIALDVNMDGRVSAGDISQIQQRTVGFLQEYMQAWNYDVNGVSNGQLSKDWLFIDPASLSTSAYQISATFPSGEINTGGYWKGRVPVVPFILPVNVTNYTTDDSTCPVVNTVNYKGIMLGEASGNYADIINNGITKTNETDYILVDLGNSIVEGTKVSVPVSIVSAEPVNAFDLALVVNENTLSYVSMEDTQLGSESAAFFNSEEKVLRHSSFNLNNFTSNSRVAYFTFETVDGKITEKDLTAELGLLNEKQTEVRFTKSADLNNNSVDIYPNPSNGNFSVMSNIDGRVDIVDVTGKLVHPGVVVKANQMIEVNMPELSAGVYFVRLYSNNSMTTERIVISE
jgi:hypothetical protein